MVLVDFQSTLDYQMDERIFRYLKGLRQDMERMDLVTPTGRPLPVYPRLVYTGSAAWTADMWFPRLGPAGAVTTWQTVPVLDVARYEAGALPADNLLSTIIPIEQCRIRRQQGARMPVLQAARTLIEGQVRDDPALRTLLQVWLVTGFAAYADRLSTTLKGLGGGRCLIRWWRPWNTIWRKRVRKVMQKATRKVVYWSGWMQPALSLTKT